MVGKKEQQRIRLILLGWNSRIVEPLDIPVPSTNDSVCGTSRFLSVIPTSAAHRIERKSQQSIAFNISRSLESILSNTSSHLDDGGIGTPSKTFFSDNSI